MNLGFQDQFVPMVEEGSKRHSIRAGDRWEAGMRADLYARPRQPKKFKPVRIEGSDGCICLGDGLFGMACHAERHARYELQQVAGMRLLFRAVVTRVEPIWIGALPGTPDGEIDVVIQGQRLTRDEREALAWRDGFRWRSEPCAHCCNWANCNTLQACRQIGYPKDAGCFKRMMEFWRGRLPFAGQLIHWDYENRFTSIADTCFHLSRFMAARGVEAR